MDVRRRNECARSGMVPLKSIIFISTSIFVSITLGFIAGGYFMQGHTKTADASMIKGEGNMEVGFLENFKNAFTATLSDVFGMGQYGDQEIGRGTIDEGERNVNMDAVLADTGVENVTRQKNEQVVVPRATIEKAIQSSKKLPKKNSTKIVYAQEPCIFQEQSAPSVSAVVVNEIAWMGAPVRAGQTVSTASGNEWIELRNKTDEWVDIGGWQLRSKEGGLHVILPQDATIEPFGFALFERGDDETVPEKEADVIYSGTLGNTGARLQLLTNKCEIVDEVDASAGWQAGDSKTKQTMERSEDGWRTSRYVGGTPKSANSSGIILVVAKNGVVKTAIIKPAATTGGGSGGSSGQGGGGGGGGGGGTSIVAPVVYPKLLISEIQLASASSSKDEFIELYNPNTQAVDLTDWYVQKKTKTASDFSTFAPKDLFAGRSIPAGGFIVITHSSSSINASIISDYGIAPDNAFVIKNPNGEISDTVGMGEANTCEGICAPNPADDESIHRKKATDVSGFQDTQNNKDDFEISTCPSPNSDVVCLPSGEIIIIVPPQATSTATSTPSGNGTSTIIIATSTPPVATSTATSTPVVVPPVVISRVQITGAVAHATQNDSIQFCNNSETLSADISGWKLRKRTKSGSEDSVKVVPSGTTLTPLGCLMWANSADNFAVSVGAGLASTATISSDASVALIDTNGTVQDAVAWGSGHSNPFIEGNSFSQNPEIAGQFLKRKVLGVSFQDTNDNSADFELIEPTVLPVDPANSATTTATST